MTPPAEETSRPLARRELLALGFSVALVPLNSTMLAVALPAIGHELVVAPAALTPWLVTSYLLVGIALQGPAGKLGDGIGHARALSLGQAVFATGAALGYFGHALWPLVGARGLMAAGGAAMVPSAMALVRVRLPPAARPKALGMFGAVMGFAAAVGPLLGGELATRMGWRALFVVNAPIVLLAALLGSRGEKTPRRPMKLDVVGSLLLAVSLSLLVVGTRAPRIGAVLGVLGAALLIVFVSWERRATDPVIDPAMFRARPFTASALTIGLQNLAMYALLFELPIVLARVTGATAAMTGRALVAMTLASVVGSLLGGRATGRFGARAVAVFGGALGAVGAALLVFWPLASSSDVIPGLVLLGAGMGLASPAAQTSALNAVRADQSGMAAGVSSTARYLGGAVGVAVVATLLADGDMLSRHRLGASLFAGAMCLSALASLGLPRRTPP